MFKTTLFVIASVGLMFGNPIAEGRGQNNFGNGAYASAGSGRGATAGVGSWPHGQWPTFNMPQMPQMPNIPWPQMPSMNPENMINVHSSGGPGTNGAATSISSRTEWIDGKPVTVTKGAYMLNKNGEVIYGKLPVDSDAKSSQ